MMELTTHCMRVLRNVYNPQGFNIGVNIGEAAGAGVKEHIHIHIVPRWAGDTKFHVDVGGAHACCPNHWRLPMCA